MKKVRCFMILIVFLLIGCQSATNPTTSGTQTERPVPSQYRNLDVPIIKTVK